jgi:hypothetical protein
MGWPAEFEEVGAAYGPGASAGLWLFPGFRVGATFSYMRAVLNNGFDVPDQLLYVHEADLRVTEIGVEAAVRFERLMGLTLGGNVGRGRGELIEGLTVRDPFDRLYQTSEANKTKTTYGGFIGLEQANDAGVVGYIFAGFQYRDMGRMDSENTLTNGVDTVRWKDKTVWLDYSGYYVKAGIGYDFGR